jgi:KaiC/GvpD/RAD55 family RecA-like ATPase
VELEKQHLLLEYLVSSQTLFVKVNPILSPKHFDPQIKKAATFIQEYFNIYKVPPTPDKIRAETGYKIEKKEITSQMQEYAENQLEKFCKEKAIEEAIFSSAKLLVDEKYGDIEKLIRDAISISIQRNLGLDYFQDPEARLRSLAENKMMIPTGWHKLDGFLGGGINRKEMIIFAAPPGVGKSLTMSNLARNLMKQGLHGIYISLELSEEVVAKRFDSMFSGISQIDLLRDITKSSIEITKQATTGSMMIKRMPESSTKTSHIRAYLKEYEIVNGRKPDFICVDYLDLMASDQSVSAENMFTKDKYVTEELRALADEYNCLMITASQLGRSALTLESLDDLGQQNIAGGISKVNTCDNLVAIVQTPQMKARGEMMYKLLKTRSSNGVGNSYMLNFNSSSLVLSSQDEGESGNSSSRTLANFIAKKKQDEESNPTPKTNGLDVSNLPFQI